MFLINSFVYSSAPPVDTEFKITVDTTKAGSASDTFVLPLQVGATSMTVYWGDGNSDVITTYNQAELSHTYASSGTYQISCDGSFTGTKFLGGDGLKVSSIDNWGSNVWSNTILSFYGCSNMVGTYTDNPDFSGSTSMLQMFTNCTNFNSPLVIDTTGVTTMFQMFSGCTNFNSDITFSSTSSVSNMSYMFNACTNFNKAVNFDTSNVTTINNMFYNCTNFDKAVNFNTVKVTNTGRMFMFCSNFNQTINFDLSACANTTLMFYNCTSFNSPVTFTNTTVLTSHSNTFNGCTIFDQDLSGWNISALTSASSMLQGTAFSTTNYDLLLVAWQGQTHNNSVALHAGTAQYSSGAPATARAGLITDLWTITDGGAV
tara:strand:+ start:231 stop:1349 length:1119 start_codon:yes stop_codon:yes gene_type:complete